MKQIIIKKQEEFDKIKRVEAEEEIIFEADKIKINCILEVFGVLKLKGEIDSSWNRYIIAREGSTTSIVARGGTNSIDAWGGTTSIDAWGGTTSIVAWGGTTSIDARGGTTSIDARGGTTSIVAYAYSFIKVLSNYFKGFIKLSDYSILSVPFNLKVKIKKSKTAIVQRYKPLPFLKREGIKVKNNKVFLYKKVSKDFKTQEETANETLWQVGSTVEHPSWNPSQSECGEGKFHACSKPYFCDEFRNRKGDKYIAISIAIKDLYEWKDNPGYPHKIGFKRGKVIFECDKLGKKL